jgi:hypothetical protein
MKTIVITHTADEGWTVTLTKPGMSRAEEVRCPHLAWDEMLGQIVALTHPSIGKPHYPMLTDAEHAARDKARDERMHEVHAEHRAEDEAEAAAITALADALRQWRAAEQRDDGAEFANAQQAREAALDKANLVLGLGS